MLPRNVLRAEPATDAIRTRRSSDALEVQREVRRAVRRARNRAFARLELHMIEIDGNEMQAIEGGNACGDFWSGVAVGLASRARTRRGGLLTLRTKET
jgi:hypothetical protein